jgi:hypothetical protein
MHSQRRTVAVVLGLALVAGAPAVALARTHNAPPPYALARDAPRAAPAAPDTPPGVAGELADWIAGSDNNGDLPFLIVDKLGARVYAFDAAGAFLGSAPVLVGLARGDDSPASIRGLKLAQINDDERTTPAGRFVTQWGPSDGHGVVLWVDMLDAIAMHPVMSVNAGEHRNERIRSADPNDHRISYGCINLPKPFYDSVVLTALNGGNAVVYVMPDTKPVAEVFPAFAAAEDARIDSSDPASPPLRVARSR